jgi:Integrase zinc binding domain
MFEKIRTRYYWPQMYEDIQSYVRACDACQRRGRSKKNQLLHPIPVGSPFYQIGIDFVGPLPHTAQGNRYIIVAMDYLTKWPEAKPVPVATVEQVATFLYDDIIGRHGCPAKILSDRGTHFKNQMIAHLLKKFQIKQLLSMLYHPQTNGLVERFNRTLCEALAKLSNEHKDNWDQYIAPVLFAYRTMKHNTTKVTPFYLVYGREAKLPMDDLSGLETKHNLLTRC